MAEKRKGKKRKEEYVPPGEEHREKPTKEQFKVAKWMRNNVPIKKTKFIHHNVEYFTAKRAVDALLESKWVKSDEPLFKTREEIVDFLNTMLLQKFFHRARKIPITEAELKLRRKEKKDKKTLQKDEQSEDEKKGEKEKVTDAESSVFEGTNKQEQGKEKRKMKIRLEMHDDQRFVDGMDAYVWIYDPIPFHYWIIGTLTVLGAIGVCLFPLWPPSVRLGVYYLSVAAAGFLVTIIVLAVIRLILFSLIWILTLGKHHLWILPNLTEDVGFFASFWPLYTYEYKGDGSKSNKKDKKKKKEKLSDNEDEGDNERVELIEQRSEIIEKEEGIEKEPKQVETTKKSETVTPADDETPTTPAKAEKVSESESESSQRSSTGKDFEIVDQDELET